MEVRSVDKPCVYPMHSVHRDVDLMACLIQCYDITGCSLVSFLETGRIMNEAFGTCIIAAPGIASISVPETNQPGWKVYGLLFSI